MSKDLIKKIIMAAKKVPKAKDPWKIPIGPEEAIRLRNKPAGFHKTKQDIENNRKKIKEKLNNGGYD